MYRDCHRLIEVATDISHGTRRIVCSGLYEDSDTEGAVAS